MEKTKLKNKAKQKLILLANYLLDTEIDTLASRHGRDLLQIFKTTCIIIMATSAIGISWSLASIAQNGGIRTICLPKSESQRR